MRPPGLAGGLPGARGETVLNPDREAERLASKETRDLVRGDVVSYRLSGAGGYGPPAERDEGAVSRDLADGYITAGAARELYGFNTRKTP